jgi:hypothetical protein
VTTAGAQAIPIGALDGGPVGFVSPIGDVDVQPFGIRIAWCVLAEDGLRDPATATTRRQWCDGAVVETAIRVHDGDVVLRVFATRNTLVLEFDNSTSAACAIGLVVDGDPRRVWSRRPVAHSCRSADRDAVFGAIANGTTTAGDPPQEISAGASTGLVWPLAHRATLRVMAGDPPRPAPAVADRRAVCVPADDVGVDDVRRAWMVHLRRGLRTEIDDRVLQHAVDAARIGLLVRARTEADRLAPPIFAALEDWGFDDEAIAAWDRLGIRDRRRLRRRRIDPHCADPHRAWSQLLAAQESGDGVGLLNALRALLVDDEPGGVDLLAGFPPAWLGLGVAAHDVPVRGGTVSFALRWHAARPALLWEVTGDLVVRASRLAPGWSTDRNTGEALLPEPPHDLFAHHGTAAGPDAVRGVPGAAPQPTSFS